MKETKLGLLFAGEMFEAEREQKVEEEKGGKQKWGKGQRRRASKGPFPFSYC